LLFPTFTMMMMMMMTMYRHLRSWSDSETGCEVSDLMKHPEMMNLTTAQRSTVERAAQ